MAINQDYYSPKSVYDRLYLDFSKRTHESKITQSSSMSFLSKPQLLQKLGDKIEDSLIKKQKVLKSKLKVLKAKYLAEEIKELQQAPSINKISKILAMQNPEKSRDMRSKYILSILSTSRFAKMARNASSRHIKSAEISLEVLAGNKPSKKQVVEQETEIIDKNIYLQQLRNRVIARPKVLEPEEPPTMLEMSVIDRSNHWLKAKAQNLEKIKQKMIDKDLEGCTFSPVLTPRMRCKNSPSYIQRESARSRSLNTSYYQLYLSKKQSISNSKDHSGKSCSQNSARKLRENPSKVLKSALLYSPLAPTSQKFSFKAGLDIKKFINAAQPAGKYEHSKNF